MSDKEFKTVTNIYIFVILHYATQDPRRPLPAAGVVQRVVGDRSELDAGPTAQSMRGSQGIETNLWSEI